MLEIENGVLTGLLIDRPWGEIVDGAEKKRVVLEVCELMGIGTEQAIAVGDGANDLPMMGAAGLSHRLPPQARGARAGDDLDHGGRHGPRAGGAAALTRDARAAAHSRRRNTSCTACACAAAIGL